MDLCVGEMVGGNVDGVEVVCVSDVLLLVRRLVSGQSACGVRLGHLQATVHAAVSELRALPHERRGLPVCTPALSSRVLATSRIR